MILPSPADPSPTVSAIPPSPVEAVRRAHDLILSTDLCLLALALVGSELSPQECGQLLDEAAAYQGLVRRAD
jgi:hypothetical protein